MKKIDTHSHDAQDAADAGQYADGGHDGDDGARPFEGELQIACRPRP